MVTWIAYFCFARRTHWDCLECRFNKHLDVFTLCSFVFNWRLSVRISLKQLNRSSVFSTDVNECQDQTHNCHEDAQCSNNIGSFSCTCLQGYSGDGVNCSGMIYPSAAI